MRFPNIFKGHAARNQRKERARELAMKGWEEEKMGSQGMNAAEEQRHISSGIGHHLARSFKGHV
ncbi:MAG: hypothetical protein WC956_04655 [bacterium]